MYKNILVCLDGSEMDGALIQAGLNLASSLKAQLHGMTVQDVLTLEGPLMYDISGSLAFIPQMNFMAETRKAMEERSKNILAGFKSACEAAGVQYDTSIVEGIVHKVIVEKAESNDLTLLGRKGLNYGFDKELLGSTTDRVIRKTRAPVLVVTHQYEALKNPLLAYDGSHESKKAMATAARLCADLQLPLTVLQVSKHTEEGKKILQEAKAYLDAYPLVVKYELAAGKPHEEVPQYAKLHRHDLLIMGAQGHNGLIDYLLGSTTEYALWSGACHVLVDR